MSTPHEPPPAQGADRPADGIHPAEPPAAEPATAAELGTAGEPAVAASPSEPPPAGPPPVGPPAGHYAPVGAARARRFGPAFGRFARGRATQLAAAMVAGAIIGGGTVAIVDNVYAHTGGDHQSVRVGPAGGPFGNGGGRRQWFNGGNQAGPGGQGFGG